METELFNEHGFIITRVDPREFGGAQLEFVVLRSVHLFTNPQDLTKLLAEMSLVVSAEFTASPQAR